MMKQKYILAILFYIWGVIYFLPVQATELPYKVGELLVQIEPKADISRLVETINRQQRECGKIADLCVVREVSPFLHIWLLGFDSHHNSHIEMKKTLFCQNEVQVVQNNHRIEQRNTPNDPLFAQQWQYINTGTPLGVPNADFDADLAWNTTVGGTTVLGDTIVVAIIDDGLKMDHPDISPNLWRNIHENPNNGIDDDGNGYIDDQYGWNATEENNDINYDNSHGTPVTGIVGARGNNQLGITGGCWQVKIMTIVGGGFEDEALAAYAYPLAMRKLYNETAGEKGAFVVVTNSSWGVSDGFPDDAPLWCQFYDQMGQQGILSATAATNENIDVDIQGDLPSTCPSSFTIVATSLDQFDQKTAAGYGQSVDIGAYGSNILTTSASGDYGVFNGTSAASPQVAAAVALVYAAPCPALATLARQNPPLAALHVKEIILEGSTPNASLQNITASGGRLNFNQAVQNALAADCTVQPACFAPFPVEIDTITPLSVTISWQQPEDVISYIVGYKLASATEWTTITTTSTNYTINNLTHCSDYQVRVASICQDFSTSEPSAPLNFSTTGCCVPPAGLAGTASIVGLALNWQPVAGAQSYQISYKSVAATSWLTLPVSGTSINISGLIACTAYQVRVASICTPNINSDFSAILNITTQGCGQCSANTYCASGTDSNASEWIGQVVIGNFAQISGAASGGYAFYNDLGFDLRRGTTYPISLSPQFSTVPFGEYWRIWIDYDQSGNFESDEIAFDANGINTAATTGDISIPNDALLGSTRMRIAMRYNAAPSVCTPYDYGEVEDYCIEITNQTCNTTLTVGVSGISDSGLILYWSSALNCNSYTIRYRPSGTADWSYANTLTTLYIFEGLLPATNYDFQISCDNCNYTPVINFSTVAVGVENNNLETGLAVYPNPFADYLQVNWASPTHSEGVWQIYDSSGRLMASSKWTFGATSLQIPTETLSSGIYLLSLVQANGDRQVAKVIKR